MYFYAHYLTQNNYGQYQGFWAQLNIFNAIAGIGITLFAFTYPPEKLIGLFKRISFKYFAAYFFFLILCGIVLGLLQFRNNVGIPFATIFLFGFALCNISDTLLIVFKRYRLLIIINVSYAVCFFLIHLSFLYRDFNLNLLLLFLAPLLFGKLLWSAAALLKTIRKGQLPASGKRAGSSTGKMLSLWRHMYLYDIIQISFLWLDKFIISLFMSSEQTAIYINGTLNIPFLPIVFSAVSSAALIHLATNSDKATQLNISKNIGRILSSVAFPLFLFLFFFNKEFIVFFFSAKYLASIPVFICSIFILPFRAYAHTLILQNCEKGKIINKGAVMDIGIALLLMYPMYLWLGLPGVALSFVLSTGFQVAYYLFQTQKLLQVKIMDLFPLANWLKKIVGFGALGLILRFGSSLYLPGAAGMFIAGAVMGGLALIVLFKENQRIKSESA